jgi:hypothetical protein
VRLFAARLAQHVKLRLRRVLPHNDAPL